METKKYFRPMEYSDEDMDSDSDNEFRGCTFEVQLQCQQPSIDNPDHVPIDAGSPSISGDGSDTSNPKNLLSLAGVNFVDDSMNEDDGFMFEESDAASLSSSQIAHKQHIEELLKPRKDDWNEVESDYEEPKSPLNSGFKSPTNSEFNPPPNLEFESPPNSGYKSPPNSGFKSPPNSGFKSTRTSNPIPPSVSSNAPDPLLGSAEQPSLFGIKKNAIPREPKYADPMAVRELRLRAQRVVLEREKLEANRRARTDRAMLLANQDLLRQAVRALNRKNRRAPRKRERSRNCVCTWDAPKYRIDGNGTQYQLPVPHQNQILLMLPNSVPGMFYNYGRVDYGQPVPPPPQANTSTAPPQTRRAKTQDDDVQFITPDEVRKSADRPPPKSPRSEVSLSTAFPRLHISHPTGNEATPNMSKEVDDDCIVLSDDEQQMEADNNNLATAKTENEEARKIVEEALTNDTVHLDVLQEISELNRTHEADASAVQEKLWLQCVRSTEVFSFYGWTVESLVVEPSTALCLSVKSEKPELLAGKLARLARGSVDNEGRLRLPEVELPICLVTSATSDEYRSQLIQYCCHRPEVQQLLRLFHRAVYVVSRRKERKVPLPHQVISLLCVAFLQSDATIPPLGIKKGTTVDHLSFPIKNRTQPLMFRLALLLGWLNKIDFSKERVSLRNGHREPKRSRTCCELVCPFTLENVATDVTSTGLADFIACVHEGVVLLRSGEFKRLFYVQ